MGIINKIIKALARRREAKKIRVPYSRAAEWSLPDTVFLNNKSVNIKGPKDVGTRIAFLDIFLDDCYGLKRLSDQNINMILDIGGHVGFFSLYARSRFPKAHIHCYEPNPNLKDYINNQSEVGDFSFFSEAVGLRSGKIKLAFHEDSVQTKVVKTDSGEIPLIAFKSCVERMGGEIDVLKLDCEGAEWEILTEDPQLWSKIKYICMEYHLTEKHSRKEIIAILTKLGYRILKHEISGPSWGVVQALRTNNL